MCVKGVTKFPHIFVDGVELKKCRYCDTYLPLDNFGKASKNIDGLQYKCNCCVKKYQQSNKERIKKYCTEWYQENKERVSENGKNYYNNNKEQVQAKNKKWQKNNLVKACEYSKAFSKRMYAERNYNYILKNKATAHNRRISKLPSVTTLTAEDYQECLNFFDNKDAYTGKEMIVPSQDHIIPLSKGGLYTKQNIIPCDFSVNSSKGNRDMETWYRKQSFFSETRLKKIKKWQGYKLNSNILQTAFF